MKTGKVVSIRYRQGPLNNCYPSLRVVSAAAKLVRTRGYRVAIEQVDNARYVLVAA